MENEETQRLAAVFLRWESLYQAGHTDQVAQEVHEFTAKRLPAGHPLRVALDDIGFKQAAAHESVANHRQAGEVFRVLLAFVRHGLMGNASQLEDRLMFAASLFLREGRLDLIEELAAHGRNSN